MRLCFTIFIFFISIFNCYAQTNNRRAQTNFDEARQNFRINKIDESIKLVQQAIKIDTNFTDAYVLLAEIYKRIDKLDLAIQNYTKAFELTQNSNAGLAFILGETELRNASYRSAKEHLTIFLEINTSTELKYKEKAKKYITDCDFALNAILSPVPFHPLNMGAKINSSNKEYFPALTADGQTIIFTRNIEGNEDFYTSTLKKGEWTTAEPLSRNINTYNYNEGAQSLSADGRYLIFTGCNRPDGYGRCDLYVSLKKGKGWSKPLNIGPSINTSEWESQPSLSADGQTLYFLSNRSGGYGGYDIWKSILNDEGKWSTPENLGPNINTTFDESTPFIHADGKTLYFSSDGWPGMGGKDLFYSKLQNDGAFGKTINLGYPINTQKDEFGLIVTADGKEGLFSSDLEGGFGDIDIYRFEIPNSIKPDFITYVKGNVLDKDTQKALEANVMIINLHNNKSAYNEYTDNESGEFMAVMPTGQQYAFNVLADGYMLYSHHFDIKNEDANRPQYFNIQLERIKTGKMVKLNNIFFDTNQYDLLPSSITELDLLIYFMQINSKVEIEIQGHTDSIGSDKANQLLSENRSKSVYNYLLSKGVNANRLRYIGYGESRPAVSNSTSEGRQLNRRTEFIVTKYD